MDDPGGTFDPIEVDATVDVPLPDDPAAGRSAELLEDSFDSPDSAAPDPGAAAGSDIFIVGGPDPFADPEPVIDPWWAQEFPQIVIIGGPDPYIYPADPWPEPGTFTVGDPLGEPPVIIEGQHVPGSGPEIWTLPDPFGAPVVVVDGSNAPATGPDIATIGGPGVPLSPNWDPTMLTTVDHENDTRDAIAAWQTLMPGVPVPANASPIEIYMQLMEQTQDPSVRDWAFQKINQLQAEISSQVRGWP